MSMRISEQIAGAGLMCLALAACDQGGDKAPHPFEGPSAARQALADCAIGAGAKWERSCSVEQDGRFLTIRHPDGGFRRFRMLEDQRGVASADGAEPAKIAIVGDDQIEVSAGDDRYRLPATISRAAAP